MHRGRQGSVPSACVRLDGQKCNIRCEEPAIDSTGTDLHNGAQIPHRFLFNTSQQSERRVRRREIDGEGDGETQNL